MVQAFLALSLMLVSPPDAASLVARLASGSSTVAEREEAARRLEALGREARPALVEGLKTADPEARSRVLSAWERVERRLMVQPTLIRLDGRGRPLAEVVRSLGEPGGFLVEFTENEPEPQLVHARDAQAIPFWEAVDRLGLVGERLENSYSGGPAFPTLILTRTGDGCPSFTSGPFRVKLTALHEERDLAFIETPWFGVTATNPKVPIAREMPRRAARFFADLELYVEPRMWITLEAPATAIEAVDDLGQSLLKREPEPAGLDDSFSANGSGANPARFRLDLALPAKPGRSITQLRGSVPVALHLRRPVWGLEFPLEGSQGRSFEDDEAVFTIRDFHEDDEATHLEFAIKLHLDRLEIPADPGPEHSRSGAIASSRLDSVFDNQIDIVDAKGRVLSSTCNGGWSPDGTGSMKLQFSKNRNKDRPARFRYYPVVRAFTDVPFTFRDIPLP